MGCSGFRDLGLGTMLQGLVVGFIGLRVPGLGIWVLGLGLGTRID